MEKVRQKLNLRSRRRPFELKVERLDQREIVGVSRRKDDREVLEPRGEYRRGEEPDDPFRETRLPGKREVIWRVVQLDEE